ncbi:MAG TPA: GYD domain-containing protein [Nitrospiraceae bacterium]|nr:GYD domain-containing protein [Nitrospiraceae bacterium]
MATFITLFGWTEQGIKGVKDTAKRAEKFKGMIKKAGGTVKSIYWTMGRYDGVLIFDAPDDETATAVLMTAGSMGNVRSETLRAFGEQEIQRILDKVGA